MLDKMIQRSQDHDAHKDDAVIPARQVHFDETAAMVIPSTLDGIDAPPMTLTDHAMGQVFSKLAPAVYGTGTKKSLPGDYLRAIPRDLLATSLNRHLEKVNGNRWLVRTNASVVRAVLAGDYPGRAIDGAFENTQYLNILDGLIEAERHKFPDLAEVKGGCSVDADMFNLRIIWRNDPRGGSGQGYGIGAFIQNDEIGGHKLRVYGLLKRTACDNSIVIDNDNTFDFIHRGSFAAMKMKFKEAIGVAFRVAAKTLDVMLEAEADEIPDFADVMAGLAEEHRWPQPIRDSVMAGTEAQQTRAAIVNGVTWAAHKLPDLDPEARLTLEALGGQLLFAPAKQLARYAVKHQVLQASLN